MTKDDIALIILHALMSNPSATPRSMSEVFDIADAFIHEQEIRNEKENRSPDN